MQVTQLYLHFYFTYKELKLPVYDDSFIIQDYFYFTYKELKPLLFAQSNLKFSDFYFTYKELKLRKSQEKKR